MRTLTRTDAARELTKIGFPKIFGEIVLGQHKKYGSSFRVYFESPSEFYRLLREHPEDIPFPETILPLHESNCDLFWSYVPPPQGIFIQHSIEWPASAYRVIAKSLPEYLEYEVRQLCEFGVEPEELRSIGKILGYPEIERLVAELD